MCNDAEFSTFALANVNAYILDKFLPSICLCSQFFFFAKQKREIFLDLKGLKKEKEKARKKERKRRKEKRKRGKGEARKKKKTSRFTALGSFILWFAELCVLRHCFMIFEECFFSKLFDA